MRKLTISFSCLGIVQLCFTKLRNFDSHIKHLHAISNSVLDKIVSEESSYLQRRVKLIVRGDGEQVW